MGTVYTKFQDSTFRPSATKLICLPEALPDGIAIFVREDRMKEALTSIPVTYHKNHSAQKQYPNHLLRMIGWSSIEYVKFDKMEMTFYMQSNQRVRLYFAHDEEAVALSFWLKLKRQPNMHPLDDELMLPVLGPKKIDEINRSFRLLNRFPAPRYLINDMYQDVPDIDEVLQANVERIVPKVVLDLMQEHTGHNMEVMVRIMAEQEGQVGRILFNPDNRLDVMNAFEAMCNGLNVYVGRKNKLIKRNSSWIKRLWIEGL